MGLLSLGKLDKGAAASPENYITRNERWFNHKQKNPLKEEVNGGIEYLYFWHDILIQVRYKHGSDEAVACYWMLGFVTKN